MNNEKISKRAVILLSGGLDSTTLLYYVKQKGFQPHCLILDYGQRHRKEIHQAKRIAQHGRCPFEIVKVNLPWNGSALLDKNILLPYRKKISLKEIPVTYVPARNIIFLSFAASYAEVIGAKVVFIGANIVDYSGYPDCRPEFFKSFEAALQKGLKGGVEGHKIKIYAPFVHKTKAQIVRLGHRLKVPYHLTWSCYAGKKIPCGKCDSCLFRKKGFEEAGLMDPLEQRNEC